MRFQSSDVKIYSVKEQKLVLVELPVEDGPALSCVLGPVASYQSHDATAVFGLSPGQVG